MDSIVLDLQRSANDPSMGVVDLLRMALTVARKLDLNNVFEWLRHELHGYGPEAELPSYRRVKGEFKGQHPMYGLVPVVQDGPTIVPYEIRTPLSEIVRNASAQGIVGVSAGTRPIRPGSEVHLPVLFVIQQTTLHGIVDSVRSYVLEWALDLEKQGIMGDGLTFSSKEKTAAQQAASYTNNFFGPVGNAVVQQSSSGDATLHVQHRAVEAMLEQIEQHKHELAPEAAQVVSAKVAEVRGALADGKPSRRVIDQVKELGDVLRAANAASDLVKVVYSVSDFISSIGF